MDKPTQFRDPQLDMSGKVIGFYEREFYVFSNFSSFQVDYKGRRWATSEHAYQASHYFESAPDLIEQIFNARSAHEAYIIAKVNANKAPENWDDIKVDIMYEICKLKLQQNPYVKQKLLQTCDLYMVEDSPTDDFWGWGKQRDGRNELGKIWMQLREEAKFDSA
jgi:ribA/ribD-fused uncharacterized protein